MLRRTGIAIVLLTAVSFMSGCDEPPPVTNGNMYVDNSTRDTMIVSLDGEEVIRVPSGECVDFRIRLGARKFKVTSGGKVLFDKKVTLVYDHPRTEPTFMLNPGRPNRYCRVEIVYGNDDLTEGMASGFTSAIVNSQAKKAVGNDPEAQKRWVAAQKRKLSYDRILGGMKPFGGTTISRFSRTDFILTPLPNSVRGSKYSSSSRRSVVVRIPREMYSMIRKMEKVQKPTKQDFEKVKALRFVATKIADSVEG